MVALGNPSHREAETDASCDEGTASPATPGRDFRSRWRMRGHLVHHLVFPAVGISIGILGDPGPRIHGFGYRGKGSANREPQPKPASPAQPAAAVQPQPAAQQPAVQAPALPKVAAPVAAPQPAVQAPASPKKAPPAGPAAKTAAAAPATTAAGPAVPKKAGGKAAEIKGKGAEIKGKGAKGKGKGILDEMLQSQFDFSSLTKPRKTGEVSNTTNAMNRYLDDRPS